ncbi:MobH family relaxase [Mannheimia haemolytica]|uniref:MobH family relaxase n=1 Tax=Mannheimia haemolytica TaxID=75985 RepID=UPI0001594611|nr:MobH family relaxase [Mannheimia haemolytica]AGI33079.1 relaxase [Mannheimia haemolytica USDA-ARS-USMARC-183]AGI34951.1 relaxase [Mannheimia haemolytica USDA-ARS-USMARC-185]AGK02002.1 integrating conjugative element relaxase, PFGI-1 class [Mannheimia haemolytica M42548]AGQ42341.1 relaxase [Mannheimia haemolytica D174]AGR74734.1 relaxase [Mannheimia haemolytica USMARC_2286]
MHSILKKILGKSKSSSQSSVKSDNVFAIEQDSEGWLYPKNASQLLNTELRQKYLGLLWQQVSMNRQMFEALYQQPIERYAEMVQLLPASESHHHSHIGGMLDHGLEVIAFSAKVRQNYILPPNVAPEEQSKQRDAWTAAAIYLALVHDIGKVVVDIEITLKDGSRWFAWNGQPPQPYKFKYIKGRDYHLHPVLGGFLANQLIPKSAFDWLGQYPEVISSLMYAMSGHNDKAGLLSEIVQKADQHSVTLAIGGDVNKLVQRPVNSLPKQIVLALRYLLEQKIKLNTPKGPADGWFTEDGLWLVSKTAADNIRTYLLGQGISVPKDNPKLFDEMQSLGIVEESPSGGAIWSCRIQADSGWTPATTFTLLRVKPEVAWENINDRPAYFAGKVKVIEQITEEVNAEVQPPLVEETTKISLLPSKQSEAIIPSEETEISKAITSSDNATSAEVIINNENDLTSFVLDMFAPTETIEQNISVISSNKEQQIVMTTLTEQEKVPPKKVKLEKSKKKNLQLTTLEPWNDMINPITGKEFVNWLKEGIATNKFAINKPSAKLHIVDGNLFLVTPVIFEMYLQECGQPYDKETINNLQYDFQGLGLHSLKKTMTNGKPDTINFWKCDVIGPRKTSSLTGYLIKNTHLLFGDKMLLNNHCLTLQEEDT